MKYPVLKEGLIAPDPQFENPMTHYYKSTQEAYEDGVKTGQNYFKEDHVDEGPIEDADEAKEFAESLIEDVEADEVGPYSSDDSTEDEISRFNDGFQDGYVSKYSDYIEENGDSD